MEYCEKNRMPEKQRQIKQKPKNEPPEMGQRGSEDLKSRFENMSGYLFDDVRIHYNSAKPAQVEAAAYTMGNEVYLGAGQEKHLGHELGHVLQQKRGRIPPMIQYKGIMINNDPALEREADMLAAQAMGFRADVSGSGKDTKAFASDCGETVVQMAKWMWNAAIRKWHVISGVAVKAPPRDGKRDGEIFDDQLSLMVTGHSIGAPKKQEEFRLDTTYTGNDEEYGKLMETLADVTLNGGELAEGQRQQMITHFSNAAFYRRDLEGIQSRLKEDSPLLHDWQERLREFEESAGKSVFTRDIDSGELLGQPVSGGTMSVVDRTKRGLGRIRNYKDLNRGGGGGSYVRFVAEKKLRKEGEEPSHALNVGSLASAGVTMLYDAKSVVRDNSAPAHLAFNRQDSAGRIFETDAPTPAGLKRKGRMSEEILKRANPDNQIPYRKKLHVPDLTDDYIMDNAIKGMTELTRQASGQSAKEEYNEAILFEGAKISNIKAVLIHTPIYPAGGPPVKKVFTPEQKRKQQQRRDGALQQKNERQQKITRQIQQIDTGVEKARHDKNRDHEAVNLQRIKELEGEKTKLLKQKNILARERLPEVRDAVYESRKKVSTDTSLRSPFLFEKGKLPPPPSGLRSGNQSNGAAEER